MGTFKRSSSSSPPAPLKQAEVQPLESFWQQHAESPGPRMGLMKDSFPAFAALTPTAMPGSAVL